MSRVIDLSRGRWDLSDTETHVLLWHLLDPSQEADFSSSQVQILSFVQHHFVFVIDLSPSVFSVAADGDYIIYDAIISSLFSALQRLLAINSEPNQETLKDVSNREIRISVVGFSTVHTPNTRQAFLLCAPLTEDSLKNLNDRLTDYVRLLVKQYEPIAKNWLVGDSDEQILLIPGLFESDTSEDESDYSSDGQSHRRNKPTLELGTSDIAMIDQMRIAHRIAQLTVGRARTVALFVTDGVTDLPTPAVTDYLISIFRCSGIPCCFVLATTPDPSKQRKREGLAPSSYFAHLVNRALLETIAAATNGVMCYSSRQPNGSFDVGEKLIERILYERLWCVGCHAFDSSSPQPQHVRLPYRKIPVTILVYPLVSARFAHGFKKCRSVHPESPTDANLCLRWHPHITIRYFISQTVLEVWLEGEPGILHSVYPTEADGDGGLFGNIEDTASRPVRSSRQTIALQTGKELFRYLSKLAGIDDMLMKIYNTASALLPADPVLRAVPIFVYIPKDRQLAAHESLRPREFGGKKQTEAEGGEVEDISAFIGYWRNIANLTANINNLKLIFLTKTSQYFLNYDRPLPKVLLTASSPGVGPAPRQNSALGCRLALNNIVTFLRTNWASFELIENRCFVKFISDTQDIYCIVRLSDRHAPVATVHVSFLRGTEQNIINKELQDLHFHFQSSMVSSSKHTEISAMFPLSIPSDSFFVEPHAWLANFASSNLIPEYRTLLASIEHSLPARVRPMTNATLLSRIYRADRVIYELLMPGGMSPRSQFNRVLRSFIKRKLMSGYRFSAATSNYLCFGLQLKEDGKPEDANADDDNSAFFRPFLQFNLSYSVEEVIVPTPNMTGGENSSGGNLKAEDQPDTRPPSASVAPPRRLSLAVGVSSTETLLFRIVTELWTLPVGVNDTGAVLDQLIVDTHRQDFYLIAKLYSYFAFRLVCIIANTQKSNYNKTQHGFALPPSDQWHWNPVELSEEPSNKVSILGVLSHPVLTLTAHPDLYQLLSNSQEVTIRVPLLRCLSEKGSPENVQAANTLRDLILASLAERFPYRATLIGHSKKPNDKGFITDKDGGSSSTEYTMFALTADRPEHVFLMFVPTQTEAWLRSSETLSANSYISLYLYVCVFDWLLLDREASQKARPADLTVDVAEDIFAVENLNNNNNVETAEDGADKTPPKPRGRVNSTPAGANLLDASTFGADNGGDANSGADTYLLGSVQGVKLADMLASIYVSAVYRCLNSKLPICCTDFELAVSSLCTESVCSEIDLKQLLLLHGTGCPEGIDCDSKEDSRFNTLISQWFQPVPCSPFYHFFKPPEALETTGGTDNEDDGPEKMLSISGSFDTSWQQFSPDRNNMANNTNDESQTRATSPSGLTTTSRTTSCVDDEFDEDDDGDDRDDAINEAGSEDERDSLSDDSGMPPPPLFLHCTCSVMVKSSGDQPSSLIHIPLSHLPRCLKSLLKSNNNGNNNNSEEVDPALSLSDAIVNSVVSVTLDIICIAPNPLRLPTSVSSTPVHRSAPVVNVANAMPLSEGNIGARRNFRRRVSSAMVKESDGIGYFQTLSLHSSQYMAVSSLVRQLHWLVFDEMIMSVPSHSLDLAQLASHIVDTLKICELSPTDSSEDLLKFSPLVRRKRRPLAFVFGMEQSQLIFASNLNGWTLRTLGAIVRRLHDCPFFYCAIPVSCASEAGEHCPPTAVTAVSSTPCELNPGDKSDHWPGNIAATSEGDLASASSMMRKPGSVLVMGQPTTHVLIPHLRRRHQSAAPLVPLRPPPIGQLFSRSRQLSSSRRHVETVSPPLGLAAPLFMSPEKSTGADSLSTTASSPRSIFTGRGYESDSELTADGHGLEEVQFTTTSPVGVHNSQTCWVFCKIGHKLCKFFVYVPWIARDSEKSSTAMTLLSDLMEAVEKCVRRTNQLLLLKDMHERLAANQLMIPGGDEGERSFHEHSVDSKLADELSLPPEHFACPVQYTFRFHLNPSLKLSAPLFHHQLGRINLPMSGLSDSLGSSAATVAGRALTVVHGALHYAFVANRRDTFVYRQTVDKNQSDLLYYLIFKAGQANIEERSDNESSSVDSNLLSSSVIHRDASLASFSLATTAPTSRQTSQTSTDSYPSVLSTSLSGKHGHWWLDMHVHGLDPPDMGGLETLISLLQGALDNAVLTALLSALLKNPMHRLTSLDVDFIQHAHQPLQFYFPLPSAIAQYNPQAWFSYFRQTFLSGCANMPHFSLPPGALTAEAIAANTYRFRDNTTIPPSPLDPTNTFLFFTRIESRNHGIACINVSLIPPQTETATPPTPVDWLTLLATVSSSSNSFTETIRSSKKSETRSLTDWSLHVRVWERGEVMDVLEPNIERCVASATADVVTEGVVSALFQQRLTGANAGDPNDEISSWLQLNAFLEYVNCHLSPHAPVVAKRFTFPLMRATAWLDVGCRCLSPPIIAAGLSASGGAAELAALSGARLYSCQSTPPYLSKRASTNEQEQQQKTDQTQTPAKKFSLVPVKDLKNVANSHRKMSSRHWVVLSSNLPADWKKHTPSAPPSLAPRQCFAMIFVQLHGLASYSASILMYNVVQQRCDHVFAELETMASLTDLQVRCGSDVIFQKAGLFAAQNLTIGKTMPSVLEMLNLLSGKPESVKHVANKARNLPNSVMATNKMEPWINWPYGRIVLRDQLALPIRTVSPVCANSGFVTDTFTDFCRQIITAAESNYRRREAFISCQKIVASLEHPQDDAAAAAVGQLQNASGGNRMSGGGNAAANRGAKQRIAAAKAQRRMSGHRLQAIRSSSTTIATLDNNAVNILRHSSRLQHFVSAPLILNPLWRSIALGRVAQNISSTSQSKQAVPPLPVEQLGLYTWFKDEYIAYIQRNLWLFELAVVPVSSQSGAQFVSQMFNPSSTMAPNHVQSLALPQPQHKQPQFTFLLTHGGILLFQCDLRGIDLHLRVYTWERSRTTIAVAARFAELVDRCRTMTHLHSFCYDQHVRMVQAWVLDGQSVWPHDHAAIIRDLVPIYQRTPIYAASLISAGNARVHGLRFMSCSEILHKLAANQTERSHSFELTVRQFKQTPLLNANGEKQADIEVPELVLAGRELLDPDLATRIGSSDIILTTLIATLRPVVRYSPEGIAELSENELEMLFAVATTTKRWKELFPLETRRLRADEISALSGPKKKAIARDLMAIAAALPSYIPFSFQSDRCHAVNVAENALRMLVMGCYRQGLAESQWRRITSAADVLTQSMQNHGGSRPETLTCSDLRVLTRESNRPDEPRSRKNTDESSTLSGDDVDVSMGCQALPLSIVDSRLARLRLASPSPALARALRNRFPLTVWLPGPPSNETRPEYTLIIAQDRMCAVVIAWPTVTSAQPPSTPAAASTAGGLSTLSTPASTIKAATTQLTTPLSFKSSTSATTSPEQMLQSALSSPSSNAAKKPFTLEAAELFFLSRHLTATPTVMPPPSSSETPVTPGSPAETVLSGTHTYSLFSNPAHRVFTESIIGCLASDYIRNLLDRATPGKP